MKIYIVVEEQLQSGYIRNCVAFFDEKKAEQRAEEMYTFIHCIDTNINFYVQELDVQDEPDTRLFE